MRRSTDRILTTHIGSLPRPDELIDLLQAKSLGKAIDQEAFDARVRAAVSDVVAKQAELGIDVLNDGEQGKPSFITYIRERLSGLDTRGSRGFPWAGSREEASFPAFYGAMKATAAGPNRTAQMICTGPLKYVGHAALRAELDLFRSALAGKRYVEAFVPAISPTNIENWIDNEYYKSADEFLAAIADAMHEEYRAIVDAGFLLQVDDPRLATYYAMTPDRSLAECRKWAMSRVEMLNHALRGIPEEKIRFHTCYSINMGPRIHDMELKDLVDIMLSIRAGAYSFEAANPRHEHEWRLWEHVKLPAGKVLVPGVISHTTVLVEHPALVAERIARYASVVGRANVIAGADCGFASFASTREIDASIVWAKLAALVEGARLASKELWR
jgi:5-methyltetrahydropteroyltriglutamate--homocysteine methyltransferase